LNRWGLPDAGEQVDRDIAAQQCIINFLVQVEARQRHAGTQIGAMRSYLEEQMERLNGMTPAVFDLAMQHLQLRRDVEVTGEVIRLRSHLVAVPDSP
jgi:hypothetical protein